MERLTGRKRKAGGKKNVHEVFWLSTCRRFWAFGVLLASLLVCLSAGTQVYAAQGYKEGTGNVTEQSDMENHRTSEQSGTNDETSDDSSVVQAFADQYDYGEIDETLKNLFPEERLDFKETLMGVLSGDITFSAELLNQLVKEQLSYAFASSKENLIHILMLAIMAAVFTNFARVFGSSQVADTGFFVMYLLIVALCLNSSQIVMDWVEEGIGNLTQFMTVFCPVYFPAVAVAKGSLTAISFYSLTLFLVYLVEMFLQYVVLPAIHIYILVSMMNYLTKESYLSKLAELIQTVLVWTMKTILAGVVGLNLVQGLLSPAMDTVKRSALTRGAEAIPGIGDAIGGVTEVIFASAVLVKNGIGVVGAIICFALCLMPMVQIGAIALLYKLAAALMQPVSDGRIIGCMETVGEGMKLLIRAVFTVGLLFLITIILVAASTGVT